MTAELRNHVFWNYPDPLLLADIPSGRFLDVNQAALDLLDYPREAFLQLTVAELCPQKYNPALAGYIRRLQQTDRSSMEVAMCPADGTLRNFLVSTQIIDAGSPSLALLIIEILAMVENERLVKQLAEHMPGIVYVLEELPDGEVSMSFTSDSVRTILGIDPEELRSDPRSHYRVILPQDLEKVKSIHDQALREKNGWNIDYRIQHPDTGEIKWISGKAVPHYRRNGTMFWYGYVADMSDVRRMRENLHLSDERLRLAKAIAGFGVWELDIESGEMIWDEGMFEMYGKAPAETITLAEWQQMIHPEDRAQIESLNEESFGRAPYTIRHRIVLPDGSIRHIESYGRMIFDGEDLPVKAVGINRDITEQMFAQQALEDSQTQLGLVNYHLRERVKELTLLHRMSRLLQSASSFSPQLLQALADMLPAGWLYPEFCAARISWGEYRACTSNWLETPWIQSADFEAGGISGRVEIAYLEEVSTLDEGPFMQEERALINSLAEMLQIYLEQQEAHRTKMAHEARLTAKNQHLLDIARTQSHEVRRPLANILGLIDILQKTQAPADLMDHLAREAQALDGIIHKIVRQSEQAMGVYEPVDPPLGPEDAGPF
ncbi:MAG: PAS domain-containing protein [Candidatus Sericytochromatia bacterium]